MRSRLLASHRFGHALLGICAILALPLRSAETGQWQEGTHYQLSKAAPVDEWEESTVVVSIFVSYAYAESTKVVRDFPKWKASLPKFVYPRLRVYAHDERTLALAQLFVALETLKRPDLHLQVFLEQHTPGKTLVVTNSDGQALNETLELQERFLQKHGVTPEDFRRAINDPRNKAEVRAALDLYAMHQHGFSAAPTVVVNDKYLTDIRQVGAKHINDTPAATDRLFDLTNHLIALADIDNVQAAATASGLLRDLAADPVLHVWHTVVPNLFEMERKSGTWYFDRGGLFGGPSILTDLETGKTLTGTGAARVNPAQVLAAMRAESNWVDQATAALRAGVDTQEVERQNLANVWEVRRSVNRNDVRYFLSPGGRYHLVTVSQARDIERWQAVLDSILTGPARPNMPPQQEGVRGKATSPVLKDAYASEIAKIPDADTIVFAPAGQPRATLTVFMDPKCQNCRRMHHDAGKFTARGIRLRLIPVFNTPLTTNIWCARDRRVALTNALREISLWPACAGEARDGFAPLHRKLSLEATPTTFNARGEFVIGYTTPEELIRVLVN